MTKWQLNLILANFLIKTLILSTLKTQYHEIIKIGKYEIGEYEMGKYGY